MIFYIFAVNFNRKNKIKRKSANCIFNGQRIALKKRPQKATFSGDNRIRTGDPLIANQMLYQLSYVPELNNLCYYIFAKNSTSFLRCFLQWLVIERKNTNDSILENCSACHKTKYLRIYADFVLKNTFFLKILFFF